MNIRIMNIQDYEAVYALWRACPGMGLNDVDDAPGGVARFLERNPDTCFVAEADGKIVGVIMAGHDGRRGYIYHTAVHPQYRRQSIAARLTETATQALKDCGITKIALLVFKRNEDGNRFWESQGFTAREDLAYRNKAVAELVRIDT